MYRLLADTNFNRKIVRGLRRRDPTADIAIAQDVGLDAEPDSVVLQWAAKDGRIVLTHDYKTFPPEVYARVTAGQPMPGVFIVDGGLPVGRAIHDLLIVLGASDEHEWDNQTLYLPL